MTTAVLSADQTPSGDRIGDAATVVGEGRSSGVTCTMPRPEMKARKTIEMISASRTTTVSARRVRFGGSGIGGPGSSNPVSSATPPRYGTATLHDTVAFHAIDAPM